MKKVHVSMIVGLLMIATGAFADFNIQNLTNLATLDSQLAPLVKVFGTALNTGIYAPSGKLFVVGVQAQGVTFDKAGVLSPLSGVPLLPASLYGYVGVRFPLVKVGLYVRGMSAPFPGIPLTYIGFGASYDRNVMLLLNIKAVGSYNMMSLSPDLKQTSGGTTTSITGDVSMKSYSLNVYATLMKVPLVKPFIFVGTSKNMFDLKSTVVVTTTSPATTVSVPITSSSAPTYFHLGAGVALFRMITLEGNLLPNPSVSLSVGFNL